MISVRIARHGPNGPPRAQAPLRSTRGSRTSCRRPPGRGTPPSKAHKTSSPGPTHPPVTSELLGGDCTSGMESNHCDSMLDFLFQKIKKKTDHPPKGRLLWPSEPKCTKINAGHFLKKKILWGSMPGWRPVCHSSSDGVGGHGANLCRLDALPPGLLPEGLQHLRAADALRAPVHMGGAGTRRGGACSVGGRQKGGKASAPVAVGLQTVPPVCFWHSEGSSPALCLPNHLPLTGKRSRTPTGVRQKRTNFWVPGKATQRLNPGASEIPSDARPVPNQKNMGNGKWESGTPWTTLSPKSASTIKHPAFK